MRAVIYTRYSSNSQREASSEDQARNCRRRIEAEGWQLVRHYKDEAVSGSRVDRPGYQEMRRAAALKEFDVLLLDDLSRLGRDQVESESVIRRMEFTGVRILALSDGYDSRSKARKMHRGVKNLMNEMYLDDLKDKTHRGLAGQALKQYWAGGKPYGYRLVQSKDESRCDSYGNAEVIGTRLEINEEQAAVVRRIFTMYADGHSPRSIASSLNGDKVPSPGSTWNRTVRRASGWLGSGVKAILDNSLYIGQQIWNRTQWQKDPDSGRRRMVRRPESEWIRHDMPELRIVAEDLWHRIQARRTLAEKRGANVRAGIKRAGVKSGPSAKFLFSGLLKCGVCGSSLSIVGGSSAYRTYGCPGHKDGSGCTMALTVKLSTVEARLLHTIRTDLVDPEVLAEFRLRLTRATNARPSRKVNASSIKDLRETIENLVSAIASGALKSSPALAARLTQAEQQLAVEVAAAAPARRGKVANIPAAGEKIYIGLVRDLDVALRQDVHKARTIITRIVGSEIPVFPHASGKHLVARLGLDSRELTQAYESTGTDFEKFVVAGARFEPFLAFPSR